MDPNWYRNRRRNPTRFTIHREALRASFRRGTTVYSRAYASGLADVGGLRAEAPRYRSRRTPIRPLWKARRHPPIQRRAPRRTRSQIEADDRSQDKPALDDRAGSQARCPVRRLYGNVRDGRRATGRLHYRVRQRVES
nr:hypothetical protein [Brevibacillus laterosporus]